MPEKFKLPPGWGAATLDDILRPPQIVEVTRIVNAHPDPDDALVELKKYFHSISADLEAGGYDPDFLAYAVYAHLIGII